MKKCETHHFKSLDGISDNELAYTFEKMLQREKSKHYNFNHDDKKCCDNCRFYDTCIYKHNCMYTGEYLNWKPMTMAQKLEKVAGYCRLTGDITTGYHYIDTDIARGIPFKNCGIVNEEEEGTMITDSERRYIENDITTIIGAWTMINGLSRKKAINNVIFNDPATIVLWSDGSKTVVKANGEPFDPEKGLAMAIAKKALGNEGNYYDIFREWLPKEEKVNNEQEQFLKEDDNTEMLTAKQLAEKTGQSISTVLRNCRRGLYPDAVKVDGKWMISYSGLVGSGKNDN